MWSDSQGLTGKDRLQFSACPYRGIKSFFSGLLRAGLHNPSSVYSSDFPVDQDMLFYCGVQCCKIFVIAQVLLDLWELSLKRMQMLCGAG